MCYKRNISIKYVLLFVFIFSVNTNWSQQIDGKHVREEVHKMLIKNWSADKNATIIFFNILSNRNESEDTIASKQIALYEVYSTLCHSPHHFVINYNQQFYFIEMLRRPFQEIYDELLLHLTRANYVNKDQIVPFVNRLIRIKNLNLKNSR
jgi:hypothetical protein